MIESKLNRRARTLPRRSQNEPISSAVCETAGLAPRNADIFVRMTRRPYTNAPAAHAAARRCAIRREIDAFFGRARGSRLAMCTRRGHAMTPRNATLRFPDARGPRAQRVPRDAGTAPDPASGGPSLGLRSPSCEAVVDALVRCEFLHRTASGTVARVDD